MISKSNLFSVITSPVFKHTLKRMVHYKRMQAGQERSADLFVDINAF